MLPHTFETVKKTGLTNSRGVKYTEFKTTLKPKYYQVWMHIALGYMLLATTLLGVCWLQLHYPHFFWLTVPLGALSIGYWFAATHLFIHEASHYNIAADKKLNDQLADIFLGLIAGTHIKFYRLIHFDHHRYVGTTKDTENTYFDPLNWRFIIESLTGIRLVKVVAARTKMVEAMEAISPEILARNKKMFIAGALFNFSLAIVFCLVGYWQAGLTWLIGIGVIFPFFLSLRQLLEHRDDNARASIDYAKTDHGETNRMFGTGIIASTLGSAGFNRHLLHHWDPQVSCTRLKDMEEFLKDTDMAGDIQQTHTNYLKTFLKLFNK